MPVPASFHQRRGRMKTHSRADVIKFAFKMLSDIIRVQMARRKARKQPYDFSLSPEEYL